MCHVLCRIIVIVICMRYFILRPSITLALKAVTPVSLEMDRGKLKISGLCITLIYIRSNIFLCYTACMTARFTSNSSSCLSIKVDLNKKKLIAVSSIKMAFNRLGKQ